MTTEELQRKLADASQVIAALTSKLERSGATIKGLEATIMRLRHERDRERAEASMNWNALSERIARLEEAEEPNTKTCKYCMKVECDCSDFDVDPEMGAK
jgi:hypothetical protein